MDFFDGGWFIWSLLCFLIVSQLPDNSHCAAKLPLSLAAGKKAASLWHFASINISKSLEQSKSPADRNLPPPLLLPAYYNLTVNPPNPHYIHPTT